MLSAPLSARLFAHQREGVTWLWNRHILGQGGILGDDMVRLAPSSADSSARSRLLASIQGLGKTFQVAAFLSGLLRGGAAKRALVIAPTTLQAQWLRCVQCTTFCAPLKLTPPMLHSELERCGLGASTHSFGDRGDRAAALSAVRTRGGVLVTSYGMVQHNADSVRDAAQCDASAC